MHRDEVIFGAPSYIRRLFALRHHSEHGQAARKDCRFWVRMLRSARHSGSARRLP